MGADILQPKQRFVYDTVLSNPGTTAISMYGAGRSGKTFLECKYVLDRAEAYPGSMQIFIRATMVSLQGGVISQTWPNLFKAIQKNTGVYLPLAKGPNGKPYIHYANDKYTLYNGSEIRFLGLDSVLTNKKAVDKVLSQEYMTICFEEAPELSYEVVEMMLSRLSQKVEHKYFKGQFAVPKWMCTLNPRTFDDWDYVYFFGHKNPQSDELLPNPEETAVVHFSITDNKENVADTYEKMLQGFSPDRKRRFLEGIHGENYEGEVFKVLHWDELPPWREFDKILIYTDPSYKSGPRNDFKASVMLGLRAGAYWVIDIRAQQCTTSQMIMNVAALYSQAREAGWHEPIDCWFENAGMPDDFQEAVNQHANQTKWICPWRMDTRAKGDKYARIESTLVPLNDQGKLFFNKEMKAIRTGNLISVQFLNFKKVMLPTEHDDIPDAVQGGVSMMQIPAVRPGGTRMIDKSKGFTL